ncbi:FUSC family protein [Micromonospora siamensis]|uniref:Fusaric acid resistance protein-like n=1 Tax=Micromonospora siamensis TaxID=299152 RepID=A0A1C5J120_9ACTN|nr:FUSC family protein [Micromonospora siamensis]SCG64307.1 Fusaric acid resistance protein-like [Micromonospora siamensis]
MRGWWRSGWKRLRDNWRPIVEATVAATIAWVIAARVIGHPDPFFAPSAALVVVGEARGRRIRQTIEIVLGVAAGVLVAELLVHALGPGYTTIFLVLLATIGLMVLLGASGTLTVQAAVSALYLVTVAAPKGTFMPLRFLDALIGGAVALVVGRLVATRDPLTPLVAEARRTFSDLADVLGDIDAALSGCDEPAARVALDRARQVDGCVERLDQAVEACTETLRLGLRPGRRLERLNQAQATVRQLDFAARNIRVLARAGSTLARRHTAPPPELSAALRALVRAVTAAGEATATGLAGTDEAERHARRADEAALEAVRIAARMLESDPPLPLIMIIGQIRATAVDLMRGTLGEDAAVLDRVDEALGLPTTDAPTLEICPVRSEKPEQDRSETPAERTRSETPEPAR